MGAFAPAPRVPPGLLAEIQRTILSPTLDGMRAEGRPFRGCLVAHLTLSPKK